MKRKAGDQGQRRRRRRLQHRYIFGLSDLNPVDNIDIDLAGAREFDNIATCHVFEAAKKTVTVACDAEIAARTDLRGPTNAPDTTVQREVVRAIKHGNFKVNLGNAQNRERRINLL